MSFLRFAVSCALLIASLPRLSGFLSMQTYSRDSIHNPQDNANIQNQDITSTELESVEQSPYKDNQDSGHVLASHSTRVTEAQSSNFGHSIVKEPLPRRAQPMSKDNFSRQDEVFDPYSRAGQIQRYLDVLEPLIKTAHDFSYVAPEVILMLDVKHLNVKHLKLSIRDAMKLHRYLHGDSLSERMYVWGQSALLAIRSDKHRETGSKPVFQIEALDKFDGDMILDRKVIDRIMRDFIPQAIDVNPTHQNALQQQQLHNHQQEEANLYKSRREFVPRSREGRVKRKVIADDTRYWSGPIPWKIDDLKFTTEDVEIIKEAISHWESLTCIRFEDITDESILNKIHKDKPINRTVSNDDVRQALRNRVFLGFPKGQGKNPPVSTDPKAKPLVYFKRDNGCYSYLGKYGTGQDISIGPGCEEMGIVAHEIGHAIGFYHEHDRPDRDLYVTINKDNIQEGRDRNFAIKIWRNVLTLGIPYDVSSLMHYSGIEWSKDDETSISTIDPDMQQVIGQRKGLSFLDVKLANYQFCSVNCRGHFSLDWTECKHGGYRNPNSCDECACPSGWAPPKCQDVEVGRNIDCLQTSLTATQDPETLKSPSFMDKSFKKDVFCAWHISAPAGKRIHLTITEHFDVGYDQITCEQYVEIRYKDVSRPGPRLCSSTDATSEFTSFANEIMLLFHARPNDEEDNKTQWFSAKYKLTEGCGGCSQDQTTTSVPVCNTVEIYDCSQKEPERENSCYRDTPYCCKPYELSATKDSCTLSTFRAATVRKVPWGPWSDWSACSGTCGGCGWRSRERKCLKRRCRGDYIEWERCGMTFCPLPAAIPDQCMVKALGTCGTRRTPCIQTRLEPCPADHLTRRCCSGLTEDQSTGECVLATP